MIDFILEVLNIWVGVAIPVYFMWVYMGIKTYKYNDAKYMYEKKYRFPKTVFYMEFVVLSIPIALLWPVQLAASIVNEHE